MSAATRVDGKRSRAGAEAPDTIATNAADARTQRYRDAERALWSHYGLEPRERFVEVDAPAIRLRVLEVGAGEPVLFVHGTGGPGTWPSLVRELAEYRCLVLERPGWGLSSPADYAGREYNAFVADLLSGALDALGVDRAAVVGASIGNNWALQLAARHPSRVSRTVLLGGGPLVPDIRIPAFIRLLASPLGAVMVRVPEKPRMTFAQLRRLGHGRSLDAGRIPDAFVEWRTALSRDTRSMRHERDMLRAIGGVRGLRSRLALRDAALARIRQPTLHVYGSADQVGTVETWRRTAGLLARGELQLVDDAGHMPWFEDPGLVAGHIRRFLTRAGQEH